MNKLQTDLTGPPRTNGTSARLLALPGLAAAALLVAVLLSWSPMASSQPHKGASATQLADHASKAYAETFARYQSGLTDIESAYAWSVRWLDAELRGATDRKAKKQAFSGHQTRMRNLRNHAKSQFGIGAAPAVAVHAADYFATQAALWQSALSRD